MFTGFDKALAAVVWGLITVLQANGVSIAGWVTQEWITAVLGVLMVPAAVYWIPNKD